MRLSSIVLASLLLLPTTLVAVPASAAAATYVLDPVHTRVMFAVEHAGFSKAIGTVSGSTGGLVFDPDDWSTARVEVSVPLERLDLGDEKWNRATLARNLLDVGQHPEARFVSTRIERTGERTATVLGILTLRGISREVSLEAVFNALKRHPLPPFRRTLGFSATTMIRRSDFGVSAWPSMIGEEVELRLEVEAVRAGAPAERSDDASPPPASAQEAVEPDVEGDADAAGEAEAAPAPAADPAVVPAA